MLRKSKMQLIIKYSHLRGGSLKYGVLKANEACRRPIRLSQTKKLFLMASEGLPAYLPRAQHRSEQIYPPSQSFHERGLIPYFKSCYLRVTLLIQHHLGIDYDLP